MSRKSSGLIGVILGTLIIQGGINYNNALFTEYLRRKQTIGNKEIKDAYRFALKNSKGRMIIPGLLGALSLVCGARELYSKKENSLN